MADPNEAGGWVIDAKNPNRATYTDPDTGETFEAFKEAEPAPAKKELSGVERIWENARVSAQEGFGGQVAQKWYDWTNYGHDELRKKFPNASQDEIESMADRLIAQARGQLAKDVQGELDKDPNWAPEDGYWDRAMHTIQAFTGGLIGSADPTMLIAPGANAVQRMGAQGVISGAADAGYQGLNIAEGYKPADEFDLAQVGMNTLFGVAGQGLFEIPGFVRNLFEKRGKDTTPDGQPKSEASKPLSNEPLDPEAEAEWVQLQQTGSADDMINFMKRNNRMTDAAWIDGIRKYAEQRDAGGYTSNGVVYQDPIEGEMNVPVQRDSVQDLGTAFEQAEAIKGAKAKPNPKLVERAQKQVVDRVNDIAGKWENAPEIEVHQNFDDLPDLDPGSIGVTTPEGKVLLNVENIAREAKAQGVDPQDIISAVTFHEGLGHHGLAQKFGDELDDILDNLYARAPKFQKAVDDWMAKNPDAYADDLNPTARATEEVLAEMSEGGKIDPSLMERFRAWLRETARKMGMDLDFSDNEIKVILGMAHNATTNGKPRDVAGNGYRYAKREEPVDDMADIRRIEESRYVEPTEYLEPQQMEALPDEGMRMPTTNQVVAQRFEQGLDERGIAKHNKEMWRRKAEQEGETPVANPREELPDQRQGSRNKYMRRTVGKGSEGPIQGGSRKEGSKLGVGSFHSNRPIEKILEDNKPEFDKQSWDEWIDGAEQVRGKAKAAKNLKEGATPAEVLSAREAIIMSANRIADLSRKAADGQLSPRDEYKLFAEMARNADMQDALAGVRANAARIVNSFRINVETDAAFTDAIKNMMRQSGNTVMSNPAHRQQFFQMVANASNNQNAVNKLVKAAFKPKAEDFIFRVWYNMLLSSPATHSTNFIGTGANFLYDLLENTGAAMLGQGKRFSNAERVRAREVGYRVWGALRGMATAKTWQDARQSLNTGQTGNSPNSKTGGSNVYTGNNKAAGFASGLLESPTRVMAGTDEWWRGVLQMSNMYGLAVRNAGNKGLKGKAFWNEVDNLIGNPTKEMIDATNDYTKVLQFLDKPSWIGETLSRAQNAGPNAGVTERVGKGIIKMAVPFVNTPDALIRTAIRRSGFLTPLERENIKGWKAGGAERDKVKARMIMGSALAFWVAAQAVNGNIAGAGPSDYQKKAEWLGSHQENSIKVGDKWHSIQGLEPVSTNILGIATLVERLKNGEISQDDYGKSARSLAQGVGAVLTENSYLEGFNNLIEAGSADPAKAERAFENFLINIASSATPAIVRQSARVDDPAVRDTTGDGSFGDRLEGRVKSGLPGKTGELPQRYDVYGRPQSRDIAGPEMATRFLQKDVEKDPAVLELARLGDLSDKVLVGAPGKSGVKVNGETRRLTAEEFQRYQHLSGYWIVESVRQEMETPEWKSMSDAEKIDTVKEIRDEMREAARDLLFNPDNEEEVDEDVEE